MAGLSDLILECLGVVILFDQVRIYYEFEVELIKVSLDVHALLLRIDELLHQHEVGEYFEATVLAQDYTHLVLLSCLEVSLGNGAVLEQRTLG